MSKHWVNIFKALGNINRIKIITMLVSGKSMTVTEISQEIKVSLKSTSRHLFILKNMELLESEGKNGHVFYSINKNAPVDFKQAIKLFC
ncbi:MAG: hypothetical protein A2908_02635 [Candidatus Staskawiczbacteria bacterium RIFCSPLOWO2_01_FULL_38_12b]|uniref:HTH arsR-type domain-containing protein n=1 Tax=Candidatus Staskawiczbacteria bacterium RIFCSPLOWO2_01_FULL_38_12b TaxID=1802214 RepID=A0A1G2IAZ5_9BACT|nr:MAG: hypothetical protein A2908_02635 [Candidatus Staskawiczbacteria bacterium RIFCSPLOWO2_01_FULL_38_12b]